MEGIRATAAGLDLGVVFELSPNPYMILDRELRFVAANPAYERETGVPREQLLGRYVFDAFPSDPDDPENESARQVRESIERAIERRQPDALSLIRYRVPIGPDGRLVERLWSAFHVPIIDERGEVGWILQHTIDVTELQKPSTPRGMPSEMVTCSVLRRAEQVQAAFRSADAERRRTEQALLRAQKMEAVGQLTGGIAHDFNNLLQVISGNLDLLQRELAGNERARKRVQGASAAVQRGARLASQLLAFARRQPLEQKVVDLGKLLQGIDELIHRGVGSAITVEKRVAPGLWRTMVDPNQLENALLNLAINARDAMGGSGTLTLEVSNVEIGPDDAGWSPEVAPGRYVLLSVSDTGAGMSPEVLERAFDPFFTTKPEGRGTGLGLSMIYGFVKQSGGHVLLDSTEGYGTTVRIVLPRCDGEEASERRPSAAAPRGGDETLLLVDDDDDVRQTTAEILEGLGYAVLQAPDAQRALQIVEGGQRIALLVTDVLMPGKLQARELARRVHELQPGVEVLFVSGFTDQAIDPGGLLERGVHLLRKPWSRDDLARKLRQLLGERGGRRDGPPPAEAGRP